MQNPQFTGNQETARIQVAYMQLEAVVSAIFTVQKSQRKVINAGFAGRSLSGKNWWEVLVGRAT